MPLTGSAKGLRVRQRWPALRPGKGPWENYRHETAVPLVSPIARRTFLD